ncbi:hypothetical protein [Streptomyces sp. NPDC094049]|uniref:hypothetical protein n=1 Tax=Streptomyces sp. NPDC094049 TaxID=3154987 RepID=UPI00331BA664
MCAGTSMDGQTVSLLRREDMAVLDFSFMNLSRSGPAGQVVLIPTDPARPGTITVHFPPQSALEEATSPAAASTGTKRVRYAGESTLSFQVPAGSSAPFTVDGLLTWAGLLPAGAALECVWGLFLGPDNPDNTGVAWRHANFPVMGGGGAFELWHTRIAPGSAPPAEDGPVGLVGVAAPRTGQPFTGSLDDAHRQQITSASATRSITANGLTLGALGAAADLIGNWADLPALGIEAYRHRSSGGRDIVVQVDERGYLLPFGFPVQVTTRTERHLDTGLVQVVRLTVLQPEITYDGIAALPHDRREFPFLRIRLNRPLDTEIIAGDPLTGAGYWLNSPDQPGQRLPFDLTAEDLLGHHIQFTTPLVFIRGSAACGPLDDVLGLYEKAAALLPLPATGRLALAPDPGSSSETSTVDLAELRIGAVPSSASSAELLAAGRLAALPRLLGVGARIPALDALAPARPVAGAAVPADTVGTVRQLLLDQDYVNLGPDATHRLYAHLAAPVGFTPPPAAAGAVASLGLPVNALSTATGLIGGAPDAIKAGRFDPATFFGAGTKLLGVIDLTQLLPPVALGAGDGTTAPRILTTVERPQGSPLQPPTAVTTEITWCPRVPPTTLDPLTTAVDTTLELHGSTVARFDGSPPSAEVHGELRNVTLTFAGVLHIGFRQLAFTAKPGTTPALHVRIGEVGFSGDLSFLDKLRDYLPSCSNGPRISAGPDGIEVGYGLAVPTIPAGVFLLQNLALSTTVRLPFDGTPVKATFAISSRDHPFLITVSFLGGGGFFALTLESGRVVALDAQLQFGAAAALDLGVASGSVSITAGIYLHLESGASKLEGFFRAVGALDILGIVSVSVEFYLALATEDPPPGALAGSTCKEVVGTASVTVRVRVAFFSQSVNLSVERRFGGGGDPTYADAFPDQASWDRRCAAFADMEDR